MSRLHVLGFALSCSISSMALGQQFYSQPWDNHSGSHESRVITCEVPQPISLVGVDDFSFAQAGVLDGIRWWGEILDLAQIQEPHGYYIAIYADNGQCAPGALLHEECVKPQVAFAGYDECQQPVARFTSALSGGFQVAGGERYWLQISEDDARSANVGLEDFRWSGRRPVVACNAGQLDAAGNFLTPLIDPCDDMEVDLSFVLRAN